jgi:hypothetical protein
VLRARDAVGLETTVDRSFTIDTVAPVITITAAPDDIITTDEATLEFTVTGATTVECRLDGAEWAPCNGSFHAAVLTDGPYDLYVRAGDAAQNQNLAARHFSRDTEAPVVTFISGPAGPTANTQPVFAFDIVDHGSGVIISCQLDQRPAVTPCSSVFESPHLADGNHTLTVTATDQAGHVGTATRSFTVDTRPLEITFTSVPGPSSNPRPTVAFTIVGAAVDVSCQVDSGPFEPCTSPWTVPSPLPDGVHTISVQVRNGRGAVRTSNSGTFVIATTP